MSMGIETVTVKQGKLRGVYKQDHTVFRGIPYAAPPVGELRWREPQEPESWEGVRVCDRFSATCVRNLQPEGAFYQKEFFNDEDFLPPMNEDSLYLNIWTPAVNGGENLPVAFWIHGGAFTGGYGTEPEFDGAAYCRRGVILVTINYRLGALGFLAHPWLSGESSRGVSGNYGILDQIAALRWVKENISAFGGDPERISIFGQSAGSMSCQTLLLSPLTTGMIAGAVLQSAGGYKNGLNRDNPLSLAEEAGAMFAELAGAKSIGDLRAMSVEKIVETAEALSRQFAEKKQRGPYGPVIDGYVLNQGFFDGLSGGAHPDIPYMIGSCGNDIGGGNGEKGMLHTGAVNWSLLSEDLGRKPGYVYFFDRKLLGGDAGAFHSSELWYMFGTLGRSWRPKEPHDWQLSELMMDYWANFFKHGDPNGGGLPQWRPCSNSDPFYMELK